VLSDIPGVIKHRNDEEYASLGASGAISGVIFSYILFKPLTLIYVFFSIPVPAVLYAVLYLVYCAFASNKQFGNVNHSAHFWGAVFGVVITVIIKPEVIFTFLESFRNLL
jgi:membrane associated rhomboid family serine protease